MARRRGKGEGTIFQRKDGLWQGAVTIGYTNAGKQRRKTVYGKTQREVKDKIDKLKGQLTIGILSDSRLKDYLGRWLEQRQRHLKPRTIDSYRYSIDTYILPRLGDVRLDKLLPLDVQTALGEIADTAGARTSNLCRAILFAALRQAVKWQLLAFNPVQAVAKVKEEKRDMVIWSPDEAARFLDTAQEHRLYALFYLAISSGLRCGELLGLQWQDISGNALKVRRTLDTSRGTPRYSNPKTGKGERKVILSDAALRVLDAHRREQDEQKKLLGDAWPATGHVFVTETGQLLKARSLTHHFHRLQKRVRAELRMEFEDALQGDEREARLKMLETGAIFPRARLHDLRHLNVSIRRRLGQDAKLIADQVGHTDPSFTTRLYTHLFDDDREAAAVNLDELKAQGISEADEAERPDDKGASNEVPRNNNQDAS